jgi:hypothetical protein
MRNPTLATHTPVAIAMTSLFPFQMAMLAIVHERLSREGSHIASKRRTGRTCGAQSKATRQQGPRTQRSKSTQQTFIPQTERIGGHSHELEDGLGLGIVAYQGAAAHETDKGRDVPRNYMEL